MRAVSSCRVQRLRDGQSPFTVLEASNRVERCQGDVCDSGLFLGLSSERVARFESGDLFRVQCHAESAATATGNLLVGGAQFAFTKL